MRKTYNGNEGAQDPSKIEKTHDHDNEINKYDHQNGRRRKIRI